MVCEEARELIVAYTRRETSADESARLDAHLEQCKECRREEERARRMLAVADAAHELRVEERLRELIRRAVAEGTSDLHVDPEPDGVVIRFRIDGALKEIERHPRLMLQPLVDRLLALAGLSRDAIDAAWRRPVGGRARQTVEGREFDFRIGSVPMVDGPKVVTRFMPTDIRFMGLAALDLRTEDRERLDAWVGRPSGLVLVVGPRGQGKTTTLYSLVEQTVKPISNVIALERYQEMRVPGVHHAVVNAEEGMSFVDGLRAIFHHLDPDVVMVGDVPDAETARILPDLAITGHLVLAAFVAPDAVTAVRRLLDLGADPYTLSMTLVGVCAQRLPRRICTQCRAEQAASPIVLQALGLDPTSPPTLYGGTGCTACRNRRFKGRVGVFELLESTPDLAQRIAENAPTATLAEAARGALSPLLDDARRKVLDGMTTAEEAVRMVRMGFA